MKCLLLPLLAVIALPTAVNANVDPKIHEKCLPAADYSGCVNTVCWFALVSVRVVPFRFAS